MMKKFLTVLVLGLAIFAVSCSDKDELSVDEQTLADDLANETVDLESLTPGDADGIFADIQSIIFDSKGTSFEVIDGEGDNKVTYTFKLVTNDSDVTNTATEGTFRASGTDDDDNAYLYQAVVTLEDDDGNMVIKSIVFTDETPEADEENPNTDETPEADEENPQDGANGVDGAATVEAKGDDVLSSGVASVVAGGDGITESSSITITITGTTAGTATAMTSALSSASVTKDATTSQNMAFLESIAAISATGGVLPSEALCSEVPTVGEGTAGTVGKFSFTVAGTKGEDGTNGGTAGDDGQDTTYYITVTLQGAA